MNCTSVWLLQQLSFTEFDVLLLLLVRRSLTLDPVAPPFSELESAPNWKHCLNLPVSLFVSRHLFVYLIDLSIEIKNNKCCHLPPNLDVCPPHLLDDTPSLAKKGVFNSTAHPWSEALGATFSTLADSLAGSDARLVRDFSNKWLGASGGLLLVTEFVTNYAANASYGSNNVGFLLSPIFLLLI